MNANILYILSKSIQKLVAKIRAGAKVNIETDERGVFVAYNLPPDSQSPALVEDLFVGRDPYGEYFFYLGANGSSIIKFDTVASVLASKNPVENSCLKGLKVDDSNYIFKHEVTVGFEKGIVEYAQSIIDDERKSDYDNFHAIRGSLELDSKTFGEFMELTPHLMKLQLQIGSGDDWAAIAVFDKEVNEAIHIKFQFLKVVDGRAIEIITRCTSLDQNIGDIYVPWLELLEKYRDMPMNSFIGANSW